MRRTSLFSGITLFAGLLLAVAAVATAAPAKSTVNVRLKEFKILLSAPTAKPGKVTFAVKNVGKIEHEFVVIRTNRAPGKLPMEGDEASEKGAVGEVPDVAPGKSGKVTLNLKPGKYVFICNLPGHYKAGQYVGFQVG